MNAKIQAAIDSIAREGASAARVAELIATMLDKDASLGDNGELDLTGVEVRANEARFSMSDPFGGDDDWDVTITRRDPADHYEHRVSYPHP